MGREFTGESAFVDAYSEYFDAVYREALRYSGNHHVAEEIAQDAFLVLSFQGMTEDGRFMLQHGAMYVPYLIKNGEYYRLFTSMFLHFGYDHLFNNMVVLVAMGWNLELEIGKIKFLIVYFISGLAGNILSAWWDILTGSMAVSAGASGAIFGIIGALLYVAIRNRGRIGEISGKGLVFMVVLTL